MTKSELLALAATGGATIEISNTITRYCVTPKDMKSLRDPEYNAIFFSISNEDDTLYEDDDAYYTDGSVERQLTAEEAYTLVDLVNASKEKR